MDEIDQDQALSMASYLRLRVAVGVLGLALPAILFAGELLVLDGQVRGRPSLSAYYHSGVRDLFVGILAALGLFLITYRVATAAGQNRVSNIAGLAIVTVALFPTSLPAGCPPAGRSDNPYCGLGQTQLQQALGQHQVAFVHGAASVVAFVSLAVLSFMFGEEERRKQPGPGRPPQFWQRFHWTCAAVISLAILAQIAFLVTHAWQAHATLVTETVMCVAFGVSWLAKGLDLRTLRAARHMSVELPTA